MILLLFLCALGGMTFFTLGGQAVCSGHYGVVDLAPVGAQFWPPRGGLTTSHQMVATFLFNFF